jgi:integrase
MGRKRTPGLYKRGDTWHIDKQIFGRRICESTGTHLLEEAEKYLARRVNEIREANIYGVRPKRSFRQAATKYLLENQHKASIQSDAGRLKVLDKFIGNIPIDLLHMGILQSFIESRRKERISCRTINHGLKIVRRILNLASSEWLDENGLTWLMTAPKIKLLPEPDLRKPSPLSWEEQERFFQELPIHLRQMALFAVNTGCRDREICSLRWEWEVRVPGRENVRVFLIPGEYVKNRDERLVVLNDVARKVIDEVRGQHPTHVFSFRGKPILRMLNSGWKGARQRIQLDVRVHDLKHTFGRRLRAAGLSFEDRQDLLGHRSGRITTHYSTAEIGKLIEAANSVCVDQNTGVTLTILRRVRSRSRKGPADDFRTTSEIARNP